MALKIGVASDGLIGLRCTKSPMMDGPGIGVKPIVVSLQALDSLDKGWA
jgi:hypothetical protein